MLNIIWFFIIIFILILSFKINKFINYENYNIKSILKSLVKSQKGLFLTLGTKVGVGSIIGTSVAVHLGGVGSIFWIFIFSFLTSGIIYYESLLGSKYKKKLNDSYVGGPFFYITYGLKNKALAIISTALLICCYSFFFQMIQTNTVTSLVLLNTNINIHIISLMFLILLILTIFFTIKDLLNLLNKIVPFMCLFLIITAIIIIVKNSSILFYIVKSIITEAFSLKGILVGALIGIKRSIFLNELLIGTTSIASSIDECDSKTSASSQVFGAYFITYVLSALVTLLILIYNYYNYSTFNNYNELINQVFLFHYGGVGGFILIILVTLLAVTTIISGFYIGLSNLEYISKRKELILFFKIFVILFTMSGIYLNAYKIWEAIDLIMLILIITNMIVITKLFRRDNNDRK